MGFFDSLFGGSSGVYETIIPGSCGECRKFAFSNHKYGKGLCDYYNSEEYPEYEGEQKCSKFDRIRYKSETRYREDGK